MADETRPPFLKRWSQRKLAASRELAATPSVPANAANVAKAPEATVPRAPAGVADAAPELPSVDSLTFESDFSAFLHPKVDESLRRQALRKLVRDPRFNVMDGLDVYIDDYGKSDPIPSELVAQLNQAKYVFDPPKTRVNEQGYVEDVPEEPPAAEADATAGDATAGDAAPGQIVDNTTNRALANATAPAAVPAAPQAPDESQ